MKTIRFRSLKVGPSILLEKPVSFFRMQRTSTWKEYIVLGPADLEQVLKRPCREEQAYLFEFGCVCMVNFSEGDKEVFLEFLAGMVEALDYSMIARFGESHVLQVDDGGQFRPWADSALSFEYNAEVPPVVATILAKSAAMNKIELDISSNLDEFGAYIDYLKRGRLRINKKGLSVMVTKFLKFEHESIGSVRIFDRSIPDSYSRLSRELYDALAEHYELNDRFEVLRSKIGSLRSTMKTYNSLSYRQSENRLYLFEIFLLGLFPAVKLIEMFFHS